MAIVKAPLLSLDARGQLGKSLVFLGWKGLKTVRQHVTPANPNTALQSTQRGYVTTAVAGWKNYYTNAEGRAAWNRAALHDSRALSGFNLYSSSAVQLLPTAADSSMAHSGQTIAANAVRFYTLNLDDGAEGDEAGNFEIWVGSTISGMTLNEEVALAAGFATGTNDLGVADALIYCQLRKGGFNRSGISYLTLVD